jgi:hypothetical protein
MDQAGELLSQRVRTRLFVLDLGAVNIEHQRASHLWLCPAQMLFEVKGRQIANAQRRVRIDNATAYLGSDDRLSHQNAPFSVSDPTQRPGLFWVCTLANWRTASINLMARLIKRRSSS